MDPTAVEHLSFLQQALAPFQYGYMQKAIAVSALIGGVCACLSCFVTLRGWSLMGDALSHAVVPGVALSYMAGQRLGVHVPYSVGAFVSGIAAALCMSFIKARTRIREDAVIGIVFTTFFAGGLLLISLNPSSVSLKTIVMGNILAVADPDMVQMLVISGITLAVLAAKWKDFLLYLFDESQARSIGLNVTALRITLLALLAATAVAALQAVGACLTVAMLVTPGATAYLLTDRFNRMMLIAVAMGVGCSAIGAYASWFFNGSTGGCIVVLQTAVFMVTLMLAPKHGVLASRRRSALA